MSMGSTEKLLGLFFKDITNIKSKFVALKQHLISDDPLSNHLFIVAFSWHITYVFVIIFYENGPLLMTKTNV